MRNGAKVGRTPSSARDPLVALFSNPHAPADQEVTYER